MKAFFEICLLLVFTFVAHCQETNKTETGPIIQSHSTVYSYSNINGEESKYAKESHHEQIGDTVNKFVRELEKQGENKTVETVYIDSNDKNKTNTPVKEERIITEDDDAFTEFEKLTISDNPLAELFADLFRDADIRERRASLLRGSKGQVQPVLEGTESANLNVAVSGKSNSQAQANADVITNEDHSKNQAAKVSTLI